MGCLFKFFLIWKDILLLTEIIAKSKATREFRLDNQECSQELRVTLEISPGILGQLGQPILNFTAIDDKSNDSGVSVETRQPCKGWLHGFVLCFVH